MRSLQVLPALSIFALLVAHSRLVQSTPFPLEYDNLLVNRACGNPCGYYSQLCCTSSQTCSTNSAGEAECLEGSKSSGSGSSSGSWQYYTTTYTTTDLVTMTSVWSSYITPTPTSGASTCQTSLGESQCGTICCSAAEVCDNGECVVGSSSAVAAPTGTATPPLRPTSSGVSTVTETGAPTTTVGFIAPVGTNGATIIAQASGGHGLSGGAIAGIVIGVIVGVFLLILLCACLCLKGAVDGLLALLGLGPRRRKETTYIEEQYSHHSQGDNRPERRTWYGTRPSRPTGEKKNSGLGFWGTLALIVGAVALCLGLRRRDNHEEKSDSTHPSYSYNYSYYSTSASSESSDRRTRRTQDSRRSRSRRG